MAKFHAMIGTVQDAISRHGIELKRHERPPTTAMPLAAPTVAIGPAPGPAMQLAK
jgi:hypothetical protein